MAAKIEEAKLTPVKETFSGGGGPWQKVLMGEGECGVLQLALRTGFSLERLLRESRCARPH